MNKHTTARKGKRINVILRTGRAFTDKLVEQHDRIFLFEKEGRVKSADIRSFAIARARNPEEPHHNE